MAYSNSAVENTSLFKDWNNGDVIQAARLNAINNAIKIIDAYLKTAEGTNGNLANQTYVNSQINTAIGNLKINAQNGSTTKTITSISETDGKIAVTYSDIAKATASTFGIIKSGTNLTASDGILSLAASPSISGNLSITGTLNATSSATINELTVTKFTSIPTYTNNSKNYGIQIDNNGALYVSVPWQNTTYTSGTGLSLSGTQFSLNTASASALGGIMVGNNLNINNGVLSAVDTTYSAATEEILGLVKIGNNISVSNGEISVDTASYGVSGIVSIGDNLFIENGVLSGIGLEQEEQNGSTLSVITTGERYLWREATEKINKLSLPDTSELNPGTYTYNLQATVSIDLNTQEKITEFTWIPVT